MLRHENSDMKDTGEVTGHRLQMQMLVLERRDPSRNLAFAAPVALDVHPSVLTGRRDLAAIELIDRRPSVRS